MATTLKCRPTEAEKEPAMVFMSSPQLLSLKLRNGDICRLSYRDSEECPAVAWLTSKADLKEGVIGVSRWLQDRAGIKLGNEITVSPALEVVQDAANISVKALDDIEDDKKLIWELMTAVTISDNHRYLATGQAFEVVVGRQRKKFEVLGASNAIYKAASVDRVRIGETDERDLSERLTFDRIGGLEAQKVKLKQIVCKAISSGTSSRNRHALKAHATGILLYGPAGTGKSSIRTALESEFEWSSTMHWEGVGSKLPASTPLPNLVHVPITGKLTASDAKVLEQMFRALPRTTVIIGEIRDPNDLQSFLRSANAFKHEIEISIPDTDQRHEILKILNDDLLSGELLKEAASKTHGYVGDDLSRLLDEIEDLAEAGKDPNHDTIQLNGNNSLEMNHYIETVTNGNNHTRTQDDIIMPTTPTTTTTSPLYPTSTHLTNALTHIRPSALQSIFISKPTTLWTDIGGQTPYKALLRSAVEWPLLHPKSLTAYGIPSKKGILLYGPPGCSKTMLVKALATESSYNFLAVKGAELISMYVGESERATREVFRKARAASPCIIFFDEIDAIAKRSNNASGSSSELNVLTTLLNEMDGFEELKDVLVIAATNKPQSIDPALMRPGRFDNMVYIGPPDAETRRAIFTERFRRVQKSSAKCKEETQIDGYVEASDGMSGAEIVAVCQMAGESAFRNSLGLMEGEHGEGDGNEDGGGKKEREIEPEDVLSAIQRTPRAITKTMLREFETWHAERAGG